MLARFQRRLQEFQQNMLMSLNAGGNAIVARFTGRDNFQGFHEGLVENPLIAAHMVEHFENMNAIGNGMIARAEGNDFHVNYYPRPFIFNPPPRQSSTALALQQYRSDPNEANEVLADKIGKLKISKDHEFLFLNKEEMALLEEDKDANTSELVKQYKDALDQGNAEYKPCDISLSTLEELSPCLTFVFKLENKEHYRYYNAISFLHHASQCSQNSKRAFIIDNRIELNGQTLQMNEDETQLQQMQQSGQQAELTIYKGFHPTVLARLKEQVGPSLTALRAILEKRAESQAAPSQLWQSPAAQEEAEVAVESSSTVRNGDNPSF